MLQLISSIQQIPGTLKINNYFPVVQKILILLFSVDLFFILLHFYSLFLPVTNEDRLLFRLDMDFGYAEMFQYLQFIGAALLLIAFSARRKKGIYLIWSLFFLVLFIDDAFAFHESFGANLVGHFNIPSTLGLRSQDFGELAVAAMLGATFVLPFIHSLFFGDRKTKEVTLHLLILVGVLVFFGVGVDMLHSFLKTMPGSGVLTIIEDAGELFAGSLIVGYTICLHMRENKIISNLN
ncbi:hypothetical protein RM549_08530 [Salegentibacter sp. F188]|uniref:Uncharacterized protein n=1 Tax=Autumnicola patrickiae TaxID=3075591 RepID=A0ABU3E1F3_9FLAO|nr:hypothetical protein [Salegentibacter sp. F188]MDT0689828.1 hypothetical protein [Salegentibacter sp. F188]